MRVLVIKHFKECSFIYLFNMCSPTFSVSLQKKQTIMIWIVSFQLQIFADFSLNLCYVCCSAMALSRENPYLFFYLFRAYLSNVLRYESAFKCREKLQKQLKNKKKSHNEQNYGENLNEENFNNNFIRALI